MDGDCSDLWGVSVRGRFSVWWCLVEFDGILSVFGVFPFFDLFFLCFSFFFYLMG